MVAVEPYDDVDIAAGQGTCAVELIEDVGPLDRFYAPVSGGGLMAGCATAIAAMCPQTEIVAVEPETKDALTRSMAAGERVAVPPPPTIADGLRVRIPGEVTWPILRDRVHRVALVTDLELKQAMKWAYQELRIVLEPSGAASLAVALREGKGKCGAILTGGNVDPALFAQIAQRAAGPC